MEAFMTDDIRELSEQPPELLRQQMDVTRSSITEKLEAIEEQVVGTVQNAKETVQETIDSVKETVQETVSTVRQTVQGTIGTVKATMEETMSTMKDTFDVRLQVQRHPWPMMGGSLIAGMIAGTIVGEMRHRRRMPMERLASDGGVPVRATPLREPLREEPPARREPGILDRFQDEIDQVKGMAIGMAIGLARDFIKDAVQKNMPHMADQVEDVIDRVTTKLGGKPVQGSVLREERTEMATSRF